MFFIRLLGKLPFWVLYSLSSVISAFLYYVIGYRKKVIRENLRNSFPDKKEDEIRKITREFYTRFSDYAVETLKVLEMTPEQLNDRVEVEFDTQLRKDILDKQSIVILTSHQFNWEWAMHATKLHMDFPVEAVYQRLQNKGFDKYMYESRHHFGIIMIEKGSIVKHTLGTRNEFKALALLADQRPAKDGQKFWSNFLHQDTPFVQGPSILAQVLNAPVYLHNVKRVKRGYYKVKITNLSRPPYDKQNPGILEPYIKGLEEMIRNDPPGYLWSHKRWKFKRKGSGK